MAATPRPAATTRPCGCGTSRPPSSCGGWSVGAAVAPEGKRAASAGWDGSVRVWDLEAGKEVQRLTPGFGNLFGVSFSPDGKRLAAGGANGSVRVWDAATGKELVTYTGHQAK